MFHYYVENLLIELALVAVLASRKDCEWMKMFQLHTYISLPYQMQHI